MKLKKEFFLIVLLVTLCISSMSYANNLLNQDWKYLYSGFPTRDLEVEYYFNIKSLKQYDNGNIRAWFCYYTKPCSITNWREIYLFYDTEINGFNRLHRLHAVRDSVDGKTISPVSPLLTSWTPHSSHSMYSLVFDLFYRR